jgi:4-amino-4-deoxy-L-arabinose transferase-like glycosyltransferase
MRPSLTNRGIAAILTGISALAVLLRLPGLLFDGLWRDQAYVYVDVMSHDPATFFYRITTTEFHPPLYFVLSVVWAKIAGTGEVAFTALPLIFNVATIPVVYFLGKAVHSARAGIIAAFLFALAPLSIDYGVEYLYPLACLLYTGLALCVLHGRRFPPSVVRFVATAALSAAVVYVHYTALIYIPLILVLALSPGAPFRQRGFTALAVIAGAALFVLWLPEFAAQRAIGANHQGLPVLYVLMNAYLVFPAAPNAYKVVLAILAVSGLLLAVRRRLLGRDVASLGILYVIAFIVISWSLLMVRYTFPFFGILCVCLGAVLAAMRAALMIADPLGWRRFGAIAAAALTVALLAGSALYTVDRAKNPKSGFRTMARSGAVDRNTLYVIAPDYMVATFAFYNRNAQANYVGFVHPRGGEVYNPAGLRDWSDPTVLQHALNSVVASTHGHKYLSLLVDRSVLAGDYKLYRPVVPFINALKGRYAFIGSVEYPGSDESVVEYRFDAASLNR